MYIKYLKTLLLTLAAICLPFVKSYAQDKNLPKDYYIASTIPDSLKEDANSVVRYSSVEVTVKSTGRGVEKHHSIVTILNEKGNDEARKILEYDKYNSVNNFELIAYSATGTVIKKYHKSDMYDRAASDGFSLILDDRILAIAHTVTTYPATIEMVYEQTVNSYLDFNAWNILTPERSVQHAEYTFLVNPAIGFRYKNKNTAIQPEKSTQDGFDKYKWQVNNLKAIKPEDDAESWQVMPKVMFASNTFQFTGISGDFSSWQSYGKWQLALNADVCSLTPEREEEIRKMTADIKTDKEKAKFLYQYMQQNVRYVSIQLGIGGLKPFPATFVDQKKYGDCKALSNYMYALLKAVGIPSYFTIVNAGANKEPADPSFPCDPFNHIILCVPFKGDTTWLECTDNNQPFGKLGSFTENRNALIITEDGGKLVSTPKSTDTDNQFNSEAHVILDADGGAKAQIKILSTGNYRDEYIHIASLKADEQKEYVMRMLNIKQASQFDYKPSSDKDGVKEVNIELDYDKFCDLAAGNKQFYRPRVFDVWQFTVPVLEKRKKRFLF